MRRNCAGVSFILIRAKCSEMKIYVREASKSTAQRKNKLWDSIFLKLLIISVRIDTSCSRMANSIPWYSHPKRDAYNLNATPMPIKHAPYLFPFPFFFFSGGKLNDPPSVSPFSNKPPVWPSISCSFCCALIENSKSRFISFNSAFSSLT